MKCHRKSKFAAFTLIELIVVFGIIMLLGLVLLPSMSKAKHKSQRIDCVGNLKQVALAFRLWPGGSRAKMPIMETAANGGTIEVSNDVWRTFQVMSNELSVPGVLMCPADRRQPAKSWATFANSNVSYFFCLDADDSLADMLLSGDRNLTTSKPLTNRILTVTSNDVVRWTDTLHKGCGNIALSDGSVQLVSTDQAYGRVAQSLKSRTQQFILLTNKPPSFLRLAMPE